ncbi:MAG: UDP-N-acetylenolpyruvoylglucosamine reductase/SAM-dependent methyltransferase [Chlamydiales bacterium]
MKLNIRLTEHAANWTNNIVLHDRSPLKKVKARAISCVVFPIFAAIDMFTHGTNSLLERAWSHLDARKNSSKHSQEAQKCQHFAARSFRGLFGSVIFPVFSPEIASHHFVTKLKQKETIRRYGNLYSAKGHDLFPLTKEAVQGIVKNAIEGGTQVSIVGAGMSQGKQALPAQNESSVINLQNINHVNINSETKTVSVGAGATWKDIQEKANQKGLAVQVMQASNIFSVGGSLSANCHGWDHRAGALGNTVKSLTIVNSKGELQELKPEDELFKLVVGGYGMFGVIVEAELNLAPNTLLIEKGEVVAPKDYLKHFRETVQSDDKKHMHLYRLSLDPDKLLEEGVSVSYTAESEDAPATPPKLVGEKKNGTMMDRVLMQAVRCYKPFRKFMWQREREDALKEHRHTRNEIMRPKINCVLNNSEADSEWLQEFFVKGEDLNDFLKMLGNKLKTNDVSLFNASVRYIKQDDSSDLSYAKEGDRFAVVLFFNQSLRSEEVEKTKTWVREVVDYVSDRGGTYYLPYQHFATQEQFHDSYGNQWRGVAEMKQKYDPDTVFSNGLFQDYFKEDCEQIEPEEFYDCLDGESVDAESFTDSLEAPLSEEEEISVVSSDPGNFRTVFSDDELRQKFQDFLENIFCRLDTAKFYTLVDDIMSNDKVKTDERFYREIFTRIGEARKSGFAAVPLATLESLKNDKKAIAEQIHTLWGNAPAAIPLDGCVDIGLPGRMVREIKEKVGLKGKVTVVNTGTSLTDYIQSGFPLPYENFVPLKDYDPLKESDLASRSVDLVTCFIGLHHTPVEKLDKFAESINRVLKTGGSFVLRDHDAGDPKLKSLVNVVHSIFNAEEGVTPDEEMAEVRNFQVMDYWIQLMERNGFECQRDVEPQVRKGDPTKNGLVRFVKKEDSVREKQLMSLKKTMESRKGTKPYKRSGLQTYMTTPEWHSVDMSKEYADFLKTKPAYDFPYFKHVAGFWNVFANSWSAARKKHSLSEVATSEYMMMNVFIGCMTTVEFGLKGLACAPVSLLSSLFGRRNRSDESKTNLERILNVPQKQQQKTAEDYAQFVNHTPFFKYPYLKEVSKFWKEFNTSWNQARENHSAWEVMTSRDTWENLFTGAMLSLDFAGKALTSAPVNWMYGSEGNEEAESIELIVEDSEQRISSESLDDEKVRIYRTAERGEGNPFVHMELPRYKPFTEVLRKMASHTEASIVEIAGQHKIQMKVLVKSEVGNPIPEDLEGCEKLYEWPIINDPSHKYLALDVEVKDLLKTIRSLDKIDNLEISYIHDF